MAKSIGELIDDLFLTLHKSDGREYSNQEVGRATGLDPAYIGKLRSSKVSSPGRDTLINLSRFFGIPIQYFFPELGSTPQKTPDETFSIALRSTGLDNDAQIYIQGLYDLLRKNNQE